MKSFRVIILLCLVIFVVNSVYAKSLEDTRINLSLPGLEWGLDFKAPGFWIEETKLNPDGMGVYLKANSLKSILMTVFLEKAPYEGDHIACREYYWSKGKDLPFKYSEVKMHELGNTAIVDYIIHEHQGVMLEQKNVHAFLAKDGYWIEVHLSGVKFKPEHQQLFDDIIKEIKIRINYQPSARLLYVFASNFYHADKLNDAAHNFELALEKHKDKDEMNREEWFSSIDLLGIIYISQENYVQALELYKYGISKEKKYPGFYYASASIHGRLGDKKPALENLKKAVKYAKKLGGIKLLPDPLSEPAFQVLLDDTKFKSEVEKIFNKK